MIAQYTFDPDYAVSPGETLKEILDDKGVSQADLALRTGLTEKTISQIVNGMAVISYDTAEKLELSLGIPARFWNAREANYREALLKAAERDRLQNELEWLEGIPHAELAKRKYIQATSHKGERVRDVLKFFKVSSVETWRAVYGAMDAKFRGGKVPSEKPGHAAAWLRMGEIAAEKLECKPYDEASFRAALDKIRGLMTQPARVWQPKLVELCAEVGVAVVFVREIAGASVSGVTKWLSKDKAMIVLSLKFKRDDQFWFTFFHEACHVLKHSKKAVFFEFGNHKDDPLEIEADKFARDLLIPLHQAPYLHNLKSAALIRQFALQIGVPPGIIVGRMQHDKICEITWFNHLKKTFTWNDQENEHGQGE